MKERDGDIYREKNSGGERERDGESIGVLVNGMKGGRGRKKKSEERSYFSLTRFILYTNYLLEGVLISRYGF